MSQTHEGPPDLRSLLSAICDDAADQESLRRLEESVGQSADGVDLVLDYLQLHSDLRFELARRSVSTPVLKELARAPVSQSAGGAPSAFRSSPVGHPLPVIRYPSESLGGVLFCYTVAVLILGAGILAVRAWEIAARASSRAAAIAAAADRRGSPPQPATIFVAKITGTSNCRWTDPKTAIETGAYVPLGRTFALNSGWLEITYAIGTKVDLEGPAVYRVDSDNGGYLQRGKSIFRIRLPKWRSIANEKGPVPKCPPFVIHTPHAETPATFLVTDMDLALTVDAAGMVWGQTLSNVAWNVYTPGRPLQKVVLPDSRILLGVDEKGVAVITAGDGSEAAAAMAHQPPKGAPIYSGGPQGGYRTGPAERARGRDAPGS